MKHTRLDTEGKLPFLVQSDGPWVRGVDERLRQAGAMPVGYMPENGFLVRMRIDELGRLADVPGLRWVGEYEPVYKVQPFLRALCKGATGGGVAPELVPVTVCVFGGMDPACAADVVSGAGGRLVSQSRNERWGRVRALVPPAAVFELAALAEVQWIEEYVPAELCNNVAASSNHMNVVSVWSPGGLTGRNQIIGHADTGLDTGSLATLHPDLAGRIKAVFALGRPTDWGDPDGHGTHTAGGIVGSGASSSGLIRGMAYEAKLVHQSVQDELGGLGGLPSDLNDLFLQAYTNGARVHSDSWGSSVHGQYTVDSRDSDEFMWNHKDMLLVFSAGNDGIDSNGDGVVDTDSLVAPATAKNVISVGAAENERTSGGYSTMTWGGKWPSDYPTAPLRGDYISRPADGVHRGVAAFSSRGPCDDGRVKPDLLAPGTDVLSLRCRYPGAGTGWGTYTSGAYTYWGGSSMACPMIAGCAALARQYLVEVKRFGESAVSAAGVKALLLNGAHSLYPGQYGTGPGMEISSPTRPNSVEGFGFLNLYDALFPAAPQSIVVVDSQDALNTGRTNTFLVYSLDTGRVSVTLAYTDYPATAGAGKKLVNDLDLEVVAPDGTILFPNGKTEADHINNVENVDIESSVVGLYVVRVKAYHVPFASQPYALVVRGAIEWTPEIEHTPRENAFSTESGYEVRAKVTSQATINPNALSVYWNLTGSTSVFERVAMAPVTGQLFSATIPAQAYGTTVRYYIAYEAGRIRAVHPALAPGLTHSFRVAAQTAFTVTGTPAPLYSVSPAYGSYVFASGNLVSASAPAYQQVGSLERDAVAGWRGTGSVPATGSSNTVSFFITEPSVLNWQWQIEYAIAQTSSVPGLLGTSTWWRSLSLGGTLTAADVLTNGANRYRFSFWRLDGARQPSATGVFVNPLSNIIIRSGHNAEAVYFPESQDQDADGLADWWEYAYAGSTTLQANADDDGDGMPNRLEALDRTNPFDPSSVPHAPWIVPSFFPNPQARPAPWPVLAQVTDNGTITGVTLDWRRNGGAWTSVVMTLTTATGIWYSAILPAPGLDGDSFDYRIRATDQAGLTATNGPQTFGVSYPIASVGVSNWMVRLPALSSTNLDLVLSNTGHSPLKWRIEAHEAGYRDDMESGIGTWTHRGKNDAWNLSTNRSESGRQAWYCGNSASGKYYDSMDARLIKSGFVADTNTVLSFRHWLKCEYDMDVHYWDGGVVEVSTNGGTSFMRVTPVAGYPHLITDNPASPFVPDTPCFGDTFGVWEEVKVDLSAFAGQTVTVALRFGSDGYVVEEGWYIDDVSVTPEPDSSEWLRLSAPSGVVEAGTVATIRLTPDSTRVQPGETRSALLWLYLDDPAVETHVPITVSLENTSRRIQVTSMGPGTIVPAGTVYLLAGQSTNFLVQAAPFNHIVSLVTNGADVILAGRLQSTNFIWKKVDVNGSLAVLFGENRTQAGTPETWLASFGLTNATGQDLSALDQDLDGMLTWQEYLLGTDPTNSRSVKLAFMAAEPLSGSSAVAFRWLSFTNDNYVYGLFSATDSPTNLFLPLQTNLLATPPWNVVTSAVDAARIRYYRLKVGQPPAP